MSEEANERIRAARERADALESVRWTGSGPPARAPERWLAMGDPQAPIGTVLAILDRYECLDDDGWIAPGVGILSIGDHFDWAGEPEQVGRDGLRTLRWMAGHPSEQVILIAGNHDLNRVMEFAGETDARFAEARLLAGEILAHRRADPARPPELAAAIAEFKRRFPAIPTPGMAQRDCLSWSETQRTLVQDLLAGGRFRLAAAARAADGRPLLFTHASITTREIDLLGIAGVREPVAIAARLETVLREATTAASAAWRAGDPAPLDLSPLHYGGETGREGGGLLYHRPTNPDSPHGGISGPARQEAARRYDPRAVLPRGLVQACGHTGHRKCLRVLGDWVTPPARAMRHGGLRTLRTDGDRASYEPGVEGGSPDEAVLWMIDGEMSAVPPATYDLLPFWGLEPGKDGG